jgi:hypothetical protein
MLQITNLRKSVYSYTRTGFKFKFTMLPHTVYQNKITIRLDRTHM